MRCHRADGDVLGGLVPVFGSGYFTLRMEECRPSARMRGVERVSGVKCQALRYIVRRNIGHTTYVYFKKIKMCTIL